MGKELADQLPCRAPDLRRGRRSAGLQALATLLRGSGRKAEADRDHAAGDPDRLGRSLARSGRKGPDPGFRRRTQPGRVFGARRRRHSQLCRCRSHCPQSRKVYAGSGAGRRRGDGRHYRPAARPGRPDLPRSGARRSLPGGKRQFARSDRNFRPRWRGRTRHPARNRTRSEESREPPRQRTFPLLADAAGSRSVGSRFGRLEFSRSTLSRRLQRGCRAGH